MEKSLQNTKNAIIWLCLAHLLADVYSGFLNPIMPFIASKLGFSMAVATIIISISLSCVTRIIALSQRIKLAVIKTLD